jgi:VanZ family protein
VQKIKRATGLVVSLWDTGMKIRRAKIVLVGLVAFLAALIALADSGHGQQFFLPARKVPLGDRVGHFLLFGPLSFLVNLIQRAAEIHLCKINFLKGNAIVMGLATVEELSQLFFRSRTFDLADLTADLLGIWACGWLARKYLNWKRVTPKPAGKSL